MPGTWTEGWLPDGTHIHVDADPYSRNGILRINGEKVEPERVSRLRDGGSTTIRTSLGPGALSAWWSGGG
ncbi:MAG: hypothetical protein LC798_13095 [Chloroflexi bacterium]|nr:hypothetical protein [Chloroflexota bacterium]